MKNKPNILAFDTATRSTAVALSVKGKVYAVNATSRKGHSDHLFQMIEQLLNKGRVRPKDLDLIGVGVGPGSFTGLRIGVTCAKTLAHSLKIPVVGLATPHEVKARPLISRCLRRWQQQTWDDPYTLVPQYMSPADCQVTKKKKPSPWRRNRHPDPERSEGEGSQIR